MALSRAFSVAVLLFTTCVSMPFGAFAQSSSVDGSYTFVQDSDGGKRAGTEIILTLSKGTAILVSTPANPQLTDSGSFQYANGTLTSFVLPNVGKFARNASVSVTEGVLTLPFKLLSAGSGTSKWKAPAAEPATTKTARIDEKLEPLDAVLDKVLRQYEFRVPAQVRSILVSSLEGSQQDPRSWARAGIGMNMAGYIPEAVWLLAKSAKLNPNPQVLNNLGHVLRLDAENTLARNVFVAARTASPNNPFILNNLAYVNYNLGRLQEAEMAARRAVAVAPNEADYYWNLCKILTAQQRTTEAQAFCAEARNRGIGDILYPRKPQSKGSGDGEGDGDGEGPGKGPGTPPPPKNPPPPPPDDAPPPPDRETRPDIKEPEQNDDSDYENAPEADPDASIIGQIGKRDRKNDQKPPKPYNFPSPGKKLADVSPAAAQWVGHWEGEKVTGCINRVRNFGEGMATTKVHENLCHYVQKLSMDVDANGRITGEGEAIYVIYDKADVAATMMMPGIPFVPGGFFATFPGGYRLRKFDVKGQVMPDGTVYIGGRPEKPMYLLNVWMIQKIYGWNVFPPPANDPAKPGVLKIGKRGDTWSMEAFRQNAVSGMAYETVIYKTTKKYNMVKGCRVQCDSEAKLKDAEKKCSFTAGPVKIEGNKQQLEAEVNMANFQIKAGANYGNEGDIDKLIKAQGKNQCTAQEGLNEEAGTMKAQATVNKIGFSSERNPITGDETFSFGIMEADISESKGPFGGEAKTSLKFVVNSRCGFGLKWSVAGKVGAEGSTEAAGFEGLDGADAVDGMKVGGGCAVEKELEVTTWASGNIVD